MANTVNTADIQQNNSDAQQNTNTTDNTGPLAGYEVLILNGSDFVEKFDFEHKAITLGAKIVQSPPLASNNFLAVAGKDCGVRVKNLRAVGSVDILKGDWLLECEVKRQKVPFKTR